MIQDISSLYTTSPVTATTGLQPIKNNQPVNNPIDQFTSDAVKVTLSPEAQRLLGKNSTGQDNSIKESGTQNKTQTTETSKSKNASDPASKISPEDEQSIEKLQQNDITVKNHERQHVASAGGYVKSGPVYEYTTGPDNKRYAVSGHVSLDMSQVPNDPEATIRKAQVIKKAALAPADPSGADRAVASAAVKMELKASEQLRSEKIEQKETSNKANPKGQNSKFNAYTQTHPRLGQAINILL